MELMKKAIIFDLDNTIYPVLPYADLMFNSFFEILAEFPEHNAEFSDIRKEMSRRSFQSVAASFHFSKELTQRGDDILKDMVYKGPIEPFEDFKIARHLPCDKYLVTAGYEKFQWSKIKGLFLEKDFKEIHVVDQAKTTLTKKDVFLDIIDRHRYSLSAVMAIGDDIGSEIKAGQEIGIDTIVYDKLQFNPQYNAQPRIEDYKYLEDYL